jgi:hypothetical protein
MGTSGGERSVGQRVAPLAERPVYVRRVHASSASPHLARYRLMSHC